MLIIDTELCKEDLPDGHRNEPTSKPKGLTMDYTLHLTDNECAFITAYSECARWASKDDNDSEWDGRCFSEDFTKHATIDCLAFLRRVECYLCTIDGKEGTEYSIWEQAGHDFFLTRCGHGTGYWDRPEIYTETYAKMFTKMVEGFGNADVYAGDDGLLYFE